MGAYSTAALRDVWRLVFTRRVIYYDKILT
jgi:hypothetical protein